MGNVRSIHHQSIFKLEDLDYTWSGVVLVIYNENFTSDENVKDIRVVWSVSVRSTRGQFTLPEARMAIKKALSIPLGHLGVAAEISDGSGLDGYGIKVLFFVSRKQLELWNEPDFRSAISCFADELNKIMVADRSGILEPVNLAEVLLPEEFNEDLRDNKPFDLEEINIRELDDLDDF